jgi:integrase/recombinase XerC
MSLTHYPHVQSFLDYLKFEKRYSENTVISYQNDLGQFFAFLTSQFDAPPPEKIASSFIRSWLAELKEENISSKSIGRKISALKSFFKYLMKQGIVHKTPMGTVAVPKSNKRLPAFVEQQHIQALFDHVDFSNDWQGRMERLILLLFYNTGMRLSELINLKEEQIDASYSNLKVLGKGNKERIIPLQKDLLSELQSYIAEKPFRSGENEKVFISAKGKPLYPKYVYNLVKKNLSLITTIEKKSPHVLRHTFATHLMNNGAELNAVKELLGHSSLASTQVYTHNTIGRLKEIFKKAHPKA